MPQHAPSAEIVATHVTGDLSLDAARPDVAWQSARPIVFSSDWQGKSSDPGRQTVVRVLWSRQMLYLRFECLYRSLFLFSDSAANGRRDRLWERDVAEAFLQPDPGQQARYKEFEISPNGLWIDLDIFPGGKSELASGLQRSAHLDEKARKWAAELAIPMKALTADFDAAAVWRANFYRVEGSQEPRSYLAWQPTRTPEPNFHVPSAFGTMRFAG